MSHLGLRLPHLPPPWYCRAKIKLCKHDPDAVPNGPTQQPAAEIELCSHDPDAVSYGLGQQSAAEMYTM